MAPARCHGGRILPCQRETNDATPLIGADLDLRNEEFEQQTNEIAKLSMDTKARQDCCCRIVRMAKFWKKAVLNIVLVVLSK